MTTGIYCIECLSSEMKYIGKGKNVENRHNSHFSKLRRGVHENFYLQNSWNKYGEQNFKFYVLEECQKRSLNKLEKYYIKELNTKIPNGYNMTDGGDGGLNPTGTLRKIFRLAKIGKHPSKESLKRMSESNHTPSGENHPMYGKHHSQKSIQKMIKNQPSEFGKDNPNFGKKMGDSSSKYYGVGILHSGKNIYWRVTISINGKHVWLGNFKDEINAAKAYDKYVIEHNLPNPLNFPDN